MENLLRFIRKYSNFLLFLGLEVVAFLWLFSEQKLQQSTFLSASNSLVASLNEQVSAVGEYFSLATYNNALSAENARLREEVHRLQGIVEAVAENDSVYRYAHLQWDYIPAKVVDMECGTQHNYLVLNKGARDSVCVGQGVLCADGVVGVIGAVNSRFAEVIPVIHPKMRLSCRLKPNGQTGFMVWSGPSARYARLTDVGRHIVVNEGDTVVSSGLTSLFPEGIPIGVVEHIDLPDGDTYYDLNVRLTVDFGKLRYVQVVRNPLSQEQENVLLPL